MLAPARRRSAITSRSASDRYRADHGGSSFVTSIMAGYSRSPPARVGTVRPYRQRVPVRRFTPTSRHASALLTPRAMSRAYSCRCRVNGAGPGTFRPAGCSCMTCSTLLGVATFAGFQVVIFTRMSPASRG